MKRKSASIQPDLFEQNRPRVLPVLLHKDQLAALVKSPAARDRGSAGKRKERR